MSIVKQIRLSYPLPIAKLYEAMLLEDEPRQRVHKLIDLFEGLSHYLVLVGMASYICYKLSDSKIEEVRSKLERPTLGDWVELFKVIDPALRSNSMTFLLTQPINKVRKHDEISNANRVLSQIIAKEQSKKFKLNHFLDSIVQFRNEKIGHGSLPPRQAKQVLIPLELAINQWLAELSILHQQHLVYVDRVEWRAQHFVCRGTNLNTGSSMSPLLLERNEPVTGEQVYLYQSTNESLIPLHPFFVFDNDTRLLYIYTRLSDKRELTLRCPYYEIPGAKPAYYMSYDESIITGVKLTEESITSSELSKEEKPSSPAEEEKISEPPKEKESSDYTQEEKPSAPIEEEKSFGPKGEEQLSEFTQEKKPSISVEGEEQPEPIEEENLFSYPEETTPYEETSLHPLCEREEIDGDANEIKTFLANMPRFNVVLIKTKQPVSLRNLSKKLGFQAIDLRNLIIQGQIRLEEMDGYNDLLRTLDEICNGVKEQGVETKGVVFTHLDLLLSTLDRSKRKRFFERVLQKTFPRSAVFSTAIFRDEVPDIKHQEFNYAKVIEWER